MKVYFFVFLCLIISGQNVGVCTVRDLTYALDRGDYSSVIKRASADLRLCEDPRGFTTVVAAGGWDVLREFLKKYIKGDRHQSNFICQLKQYVSGIKKAQLPKEDPGYYLLKSDRRAIKYMHALWHLQSYFSAGTSGDDIDALLRLAKTPLKDWPEPQPVDMKPRLSSSIKAQPMASDTSLLSGTSLSSRASLATTAIGTLLMQDSHMDQQDSHTDQMDSDGDNDMVEPRALDTQSSAGASHSLSVDDALAAVMTGVLGDKNSREGIKLLHEMGRSESHHRQTFSKYQLGLLSQRSQNKENKEWGILQLWKAANPKEQLKETEIDHMEAALFLVRSLDPHYKTTPELMSWSDGCDCRPGCAPPYSFFDCIGCGGRRDSEGNKWWRCNCIVWKWGTRWPREQVCATGKELTEESCVYCSKFCAIAGAVGLAVGTFMASTPLTAGGVGAAACGTVTVIQMSRKKSTSADSDINPGDVIGMARS